MNISREREMQARDWACQAHLGLPHGQRPSPIATAAPPVAASPRRCCPACRSRNTGNWLPLLRPQSTLHSVRWPGHLGFALRLTDPSLTDNSGPIKYGSTSQRVDLEYL
jgi:hypothetical protein